MRRFPLFLASLFLASAAQAAWVVKTEGLACTEDYNAWGHGSYCPCPEGTVYNQKIGECLAGAPYPIMVSGVLHSKHAKTKGVSLETQFGRFQLVVKLTELEKLERADQLYFEVEGEFILMPTENSEARPTIIVESIHWLE
jgi:hypothetical protein